MSGGCDRQESYDAVQSRIATLEAEVRAKDHYIKQLAGERDDTREECGRLRARVIELQRQTSEPKQWRPNDPKLIDDLMLAAKSALAACKASLAKEPAVQLHNEVDAAYWRITDDYVPLDAESEDT